VHWRITCALRAVIVATMDAWSLMGHDCAVRRWTISRHGIIGGLGLVDAR